MVYSITLIKKKRKIFYIFKNLQNIKKVINNFIVFIEIYSIILKIEVFVIQLVQHKNNKVPSRKD